MAEQRRSARGAPAQPNTRQQQRVTLTLKLDSTEVHYSSVSTGMSGFFTVSVGTPGNATYNRRARGPKFLANSGQVTLTGSPQPNLQMGQMRAGDANNTNAANSTDFSILKSTFGKSVGQGGYDARADFSNDNVVNTTDFNLLKLNFGQAGSPPLVPGGETGTYRP